jgi:hypothetical protein
VFPTALVDCERVSWRRVDCAGTFTGPGLPDERADGYDRICAITFRTTLLNRHARATLKRDTYTSYRIGRCWLFTSTSHPGGG